MDGILMALTETAELLSAGMLGVLDGLMTRPPGNSQFCRKALWSGSNNVRMCADGASVQSAQTPE